MIFFEGRFTLNSLSIAINNFRCPSESHPRTSSRPDSSESSDAFTPNALAAASRNLFFMVFSRAARKPRFLEKTRADGVLRRRDEFGLQGADTVPAERPLDLGQQRVLDAPADHAAAQEKDVERRLGPAHFHDGGRDRAFFSEFVLIVERENDRVFRAHEPADRMLVIPARRQIELVR